MSAALFVGCLLIASLSTILPQDPPKNGVIQTHDARGRLIRETRYRNDTLHGITRVFNARGDTLYEVNYQNGLRYGLARSWHSNGQLATKGSYYKGLEVAQHQRWFEDGNPEALESYLDFSLIKGLQVLPAAAVRDGEWALWYYKSQKLSEYFYTKGNRVGTWKEWFYTGEPKSERTYANGKVHGDWKVWDREGKQYSKFTCSASNWSSSFICELHGDEAYTNDLGQCQHCQRGTSSGAYIYCASSACELKKCQVCGGNL